MASRIMHYIIAAEILKACDLNHNDFILGNLTPDAHDGTLQGNSHSHFRYIVNGEYDKLPNIEYARFKEKYDYCFGDSFILGYYCHLVSDYNWVQGIIPRFMPAIDNGTVLFLEKRKLLHKDFGTLNRILIDHYDLSPIDSFSIPDKIFVDEISKDNIQSIVNGLASDFTRTKHDVLHILTNDFVIKYINETAALCVNEISNA